MSQSAESPDKVMTAGLKKKEFVVVAFQPVLQRAQLQTFDRSPLFPYSNAFLEEGDQDMVRGLLYHTSVFVDHGKPWEEAAIDYYSKQARRIEYAFPQKRLARLATAAIDQLRSVA